MTDLCRKGTIAIPIVNPKSLQGNIPMFPRRQALAFVARQAQRAYQRRAGFLRLDHFVDVAALGRDVWVREEVLVILNQLGLARVRGSRLGQRLAKNDFARCVYAHHSDLSGWPCEVEV